jgi:hypothetical protein
VQIYLYTGLAIMEELHGIFGRSDLLDGTDIDTVQIAGLDGQGATIV